MASDRKSTPCRVTVRNTEVRLLCVEDNSTLRKMIDLMLASTGIDIDFAQNGQEAVEAVQVK